MPFECYHLQSYRLLLFVLCAAVVSMLFIALFDAVLRTPCLGEPLLVK